VGFRYRRSGTWPVSKRADLIKFRDGMAKLCDRVGGMVRDGKGKDDISKMLVAEFGWNAAGAGRSLDGLMAEFKQ
jgi:hypothetical protein